jgi:hypothetical protein
MPPLRATPTLLHALKPRTPPTLRTIPTSPGPTCACAALPANLAIDHKTPIANNIAPYTSHILVSTAQSDWTSRIEDEKTRAASQPWGRFVADLKTALGRGGRFHDPYRNVLVTTSSFPLPAAATAADKNRRAALLFPANEEIVLPPAPVAAQEEDDEALDTLLMRATTAPQQETSAYNRELLNITKLTQPTILICSHDSRDSRCGILGPLLHAEFSRQLTTIMPTRHKLRVGMISHIGGHKWAGNVIVYFPPEWRAGFQPDATRDGGVRGGDGTQVAAGDVSPLSGKAVWYGRVEPRHVEGIIRETVLGGNVIEDLFRGLVDEKGQAIRL